MKLLFVGDLHLGLCSEQEELEARGRILERAMEADLVVIGGDLTNAGRPEQYARFMRYYSPIKEKCILVRGNHDMGNYMGTLQSWFPRDAKLNFHLGEYPVWVWTTNWFEMLNANTKCFSVQQQLPEPYNRRAQPPVIVVYDGLGPYYYIERGGIRFIVLDACTHRLGEPQRRWLVETVASSSLPVIVFLHTHILPGGSPDDACCQLWDPEVLTRLLVHDEKVLGVFAGHLHFNSAWDWQGKKIVLTGALGESRFIEVENGKIIRIEPLDNQARKDIPESYRGTFDVTPLELRYWCPEGVLTKNTFWMLKDKGFWDDSLPVQTHWGWHDPEGPGGLIWSLPPEFLPEKEMWFSVNFRSTTPWKLLLEENGVEQTVDYGAPGENLIATGSFGRGPKRPFRRVVLKQEAPACGHATVYMALHDTPKPEFTTYH